MRYAVPYCSYALSLLLLFAQNTLAKENILGVVQFVDGDSNLQFKDLIIENKQITVKDKSKLKIVLNNECIAVIYGPANLTLKADQIELSKNSASRWICKSGSQKLKISDLEAEVNKSEILIHNQTIVVIDNNETITELDTLYPYPSESIRKGINDEANKVINTRIIINGVPIGYSGFMHSSSSFNNTNYLSTNGVKIGAQFKLWDKNWFVFASYISQDNNDNGKNYVFPQVYNSSRTNVKFIGIGLRPNEISQSHSLYYYGGFGELGFQASLSNNFNGYVYYPAAVGGVGYEKIFFAKNWIGFYISAELQIAQTLATGIIKTNYGNPPPPNFSDPTAGITAYNIFINIGPSFQF